jgi:hypothetical protein
VAGLYDVLAKHHGGSPEGKPVWAFSVGYSPGLPCSGREAGSRTKWGALLEYLEGFIDVKRHILFREALALEPAHLGNGDELIPWLYSEVEGWFGDNTD